MTKGLQTAVIGAGLMGHGIALTLARAGQYVAITDPVPDALASVTDRITDSLKLLGEPASGIPKILKKIELCSSVAGAVKDAGFVIEAAPEKLELKKALFSEIEQHAPADAVLASNTSVIQISKITGHLKTRHRALGTHWWNPPHMIPLVEVVKTEWTNLEAAQAMFDLLSDAGKTPVMVEKDVPGFIGNRLQHALWREAISLVENGICDAEAVDTVIKASFGRRLAVLGPLENADLVGTDLTLVIHENVLADLERRPGPSPYLEDLVAEGRLGMKSGEGFRKWADGDAEKIRDKVGRHLQQLERMLHD